MVMTLQEFRWQALEQYDEAVSWLDEGDLAEARACLRRLYETALELADHVAPTT